MDIMLLITAILLGGVWGLLVGWLGGRRVQGDADEREMEKLKQRWNGKLQSARYDFARKVYEPITRAVFRDPHPAGKAYRYWQQAIAFFFERLVEGDPDVNGKALLEQIHERVWVDDRNGPALHVEENEQGKYVGQIGSPWIVHVTEPREGEQVVVRIFRYWNDYETYDWGHRGIAKVADKIPPSATAYYVISPDGLINQKGSIHIEKVAETT